jgi:hypothetical protein
VRPIVLRDLLPWIVAAVVTTILFGTIYVVAQQLERQSANDAPLRLASQVADEIREGQSATLNAQPHVDLSRSLAVFVVVEDAQGSASAGSGFLKGALVSLPTGVLASAAQSGQDDVTWQPRTGLRFATVTLRVGDQFVSAGQSLAPSDARDGTVQLLVGSGWLVALLVIAGCWYLLARSRRTLAATPMDPTPTPDSESQQASKQPSKPAIGVSGSPRASAGRSRAPRSSG